MVSTEDVAAGPAGKRRVLLMGLGTIAATHVSVLRRRGDVQLLGGVDPRADGDRLGLRRWDTLVDALGRGAFPDIVVVATPTETHVEVVAEVLARTHALVLCEKPLAPTAAHLSALGTAAPAGVLESRLKVAHHFAFSPEVEWARAVVRSHPGWGAPNRATCVFNDAYAQLPPDRLDSLVSSWVDSSPNQLSVLAAFVAGWRVDNHVDHRERAVTSLRHHGGTTLLISNWLAAGSSKQTQLEYRGNRTLLRLDHTSMTGLHLEDGRLVEHVAYAGAASRKDAHYMGVYEALLNDPEDPRLGLALARNITRVLEDAGCVPSPSGLTTAAVTDSSPPRSG